MTAENTKDYEAILSGIEIKLEHLNDEYEHNSQAHAKIYERLNALERMSSAIDVQYAQIIKDIAEVKLDVSEIKNRPVRHFDAIQMATISATISAIIGLIFKML